MRQTKNVLIVTTFLLLFIQLGFGQSYPIPRELKIASLVRKTFPGYFGRKHAYPQLEAAKFYPMGWSRDGKFAYYYEPVDEACGCYFAHLVIQDLHTDKVVWEFDYNQDKASDAQGKMPPEDNIRKLWNKNRKLFSAKLAENGIIVGNGFQMLSPTFTIAGRSYTAESSIKMSKNADDEDRVSTFDVVFSSPALGSKKIYTANHAGDEYNFTLDAGVLGAVRSPYENRIAVIVMQINRGWEGPPHTGDIRVVGADLLTGFKR